MPGCEPPGKETHGVSLTREEMKNCIWLKPQLVAQVEFTEWTPDGHLRHSKFAGYERIKSRGRFFVRGRSVKPSSGGHSTTLMVLNLAQCNASDEVSGAYA